MASGAGLRFSEHARRRMEQRGVTEEDVGWALKREVDRHPADNGTVWVHGRPGGNRILKVLVPLDDRNYVITVAWRD